MIPVWLHLLAVLSIVVGCMCCCLVALDELRHPQPMWIMNVVWPVVALFGSVAASWLYYVYGRSASHDSDDTARTPFPVMVAKGTAHCGSGCTLADIVAEWLLFAFPGMALWFGWKTVFAEKIFAAWVADYCLALIIGVAFQYFSIKPMRDLTVSQGIVQAVKADVLSLSAWQVGMYGFMAIAHFWLFGHVIGVPLAVNSVEFWFMMQIAMVCGFATAFPVNRWLIDIGIKEAM